MALISIRAHQARYGTYVTALDSLTVDVEPGIVSLVGSNGAGKTTLLKIFLGLIQPTAGEATAQPRNRAETKPESKSHKELLDKYLNKGVLELTDGDAIRSDWI